MWVSHISHRQVLLCLSYIARNVDVHDEYRRCPHALDSVPFCTVSQIDNIDSVCFDDEWTKANLYFAKEPQTEGSYFIESA